MYCMHVSFPFFFLLEIMNCLHNYVVNDTPSFLSQPDRLEIVLEMCKHVSSQTRERVFVNQ